MFEELLCKSLEAYCDFKFLDPGVIADDEIQLLLTRTSPVNLETRWVPGYYFNICPAGTRTKIGNIDFRVCLTEGLAKFGGHIGYAVSEPYRGRHYAARAFRLLFDFIRKHGLTTVLVTCAETNIASRRTIEWAGGRLVNVAIAETDAKEMRSTCYYQVEVTG